MSEGREAAANAKEPVEVRKKDSSSGPKGEINEKGIWSKNSVNVLKRMAKWANIFLHRRYAWTDYDLHF